MPKHTLNWWFLLPACLFLAVGAGLSALLPEGEEIFYLNNWRIEPWCTIMRYVTLLGEWHVWVALILFIGWKQRKLAVAIGLSSLLMMGFNYVLKEYSQKQRPISWVREHPNRELVIVSDQYINAANTSFPSGHTASAFAVFFLLSQILHRYQYKWIGSVAAIAATLAAISRIFLVQHFLTDVVVGACIGLSFGIFTWLLGQRWLT